MKDFGLQLYSIRDRFTDDESIANAFKKMKEMGYSYAQTAYVYDFIPPERFAELAHDSGITFCGTQCAWTNFTEDPDAMIEFNKALGTNNIGIGGMPSQPRKSLDALKSFIKDFNRLAEKFAKHGMRFTYHNHSFEFVKFDGKTIFDYLVEGLDPVNTSFVLDTYWVQHGGADVRATIERLEGRIDILHLKDMEACHQYTLSDDKILQAPAITEIGNGNINFKDIIPLAEKCGVKYFVVEDDRAPTVGSFEAVKTSADYLLKNFVGK